MIVCTGHQGEPGSILDRISRNQIPLILSKDDQVIFSSKTIPTPINELNKENIVGFRVNYNDNETDEYEKQLAKDFGITYQHSRVIIKNGVVILTDNTSWNKDRFLKELSDL